MMLLTTMSPKYIIHAPQSLRVEILKSRNSQTSSAHLHIKMSQT